MGKHAAPGPSDSPADRYLLMNATQVGLGVPMASVGEGQLGADILGGYSVFTRGWPNYGWTVRFPSFSPWPRRSVNVTWCNSGWPGDPAVGRNGGPPAATNSSQSCRCSVSLLVCHPE